MQDVLIYCCPSLYLSTESKAASSFPQLILSNDLLTGFLIIISSLMVNNPYYKPGAVGPTGRSVRLLKSKLKT